MYKNFLKGKKLVPKVWSKSDKEKSIIEAVKKVQADKKHNETIEFTSATKKPKQEDSTVFTVVKVENKHASQAAVKRDLFKL